ncbi:Nucleoporin nup45 [Termitomyces sp. T112]|nr:Nucleoporin nup45 [Termitomyces sp. T112]
MATSAFGQPAQQQPTGGLFGAQQQSAGSLFGQTTQQPLNSFFSQPPGQQAQQPPAGGLFGQSTAGSSTTQPATGGVFGQPANQPSSGGLFGQSTTQPVSGGGGLFGQSTTQPAVGGGLFGQSTAQGTGTGLFGQSTSQQAAGSGGLFGQSTTQNAGNGLFGQSTTQPATSGGGLFGQSSTQPSAGGLFGQSTTQSSSGGVFGQSTAQPASGGLFGQTTTQPAGGGLFGGGALQAPAGGLFGSNQPQQKWGLQPPAGPLLSKSTKFNDLPDDAKRILEGIDSYIQGRLQISKDLHQRKLGEEPLKAQELLQGIRKDLMNISAQTRDDYHLAKDMKSQVDQAVQDTIVAIRLVDAFKAPQGSGTSYLNSHANFPLEFFARVTENMKQKLVWYKSTIEQIEKKLSSSTSQSQTPHGIAATLQAQHATFLSLASKTAALDAEFQKIKVFVTQLWRAKTGSVRDPFNELDRTSDSTEFGIHSLGVK